MANQKAKPSVIRLPEGRPTENNRWNHAGGVVEVAQTSNGRYQQVLKRPKKVLFDVARDEDGPLEYCVTVEFEAGSFDPWEAVEAARAADLLPHDKDTDNPVFECLDEGNLVGVERLIGTRKVVKSETAERKWLGPWRRILQPASYRETVRLMVLEEVNKITSA